MRLYTDPILVGEKAEELIAWAREQISHPDTSAWHVERSLEICLNQLGAIGWMSQPPEQQRDLRKLEAYGTVVWDFDIATEVVDRLFDGLDAQAKTYIAWSDRSASPATAVVNALVRSRTRRKEIEHGRTESR